MSVPAVEHILKPFSKVNPAGTGVNLAARALKGSVFGEAGRYSKLAPKDAHQKLVDSTGTWVAQSFFGTLLKQMRESPFKSEMFSGGQGGQAFSQLHDQHLAEHMARGAGKKLVNAIVRKIEATAAYRKQQKNAGGPVEKAGKPDNRTGHQRPKLNHEKAHAAPIIRT
jgi:Rod binding domain-containing protein